MTKTHPSHHTDGTICLEGTKSVPRSFVPCCKAFSDHVTACAFDIRYEWWSRQKHWVIAISDSAGGGGIVINYCPHCGSKLTQTPTAKSGRRIKI